MEIRKVTRLSILLALSIVLNIIESLVPLFNGIIPGLKIGLANVVILTVLYIYGIKEAMFISFARILIVGMLRTGLFNITFFFSLGGAIFSLLNMAILKKINIFSIIGISIIGSISHTAGQILVALLFVKNLNILYYLPIVFLFAIPTGLIIGYISKSIIFNFKKNIDRNSNL